MKKICLSIFLDANGIDYPCLDKIRPTSYTLKNSTSDEKYFLGGLSLVVPSFEELWPINEESEEEVQEVKAVATVRRKVIKK